MSVMGKKKTSIYVDKELWSDWMHFVLDHYDSSRKASEALEDAMRRYMEIKMKWDEQKEAILEFIAEPVEKYNVGEIGIEEIDLCERFAKIFCCLPRDVKPIIDELHALEEIIRKVSRIFHKKYS